MKSNEKISEIDEKNNVQAVNEGTTNEPAKKGKFKSGVIGKLVAKLKSKKPEDKAKEDIKEDKTLSLGDIIKDIDEMSDSEIKDICEDIKNNGLKVGMDAKTIEFLSKNKDNENVKKLLSNLNLSMNVDISSISQFRTKDINNVNKLFEGTGCNIGKVFVNAGWDEAACKGYSFDKYKTITEKAEEMVNAALKKLPPNASEEKKFRAIYDMALKNAKHYDDFALNEGSANFHTARNLEGFFIKGKSVCAGNAVALKNLLECAGIEVEYVQGYTSESYHAWNKVKINGNWYNCDLTWDACNVGKSHEFCLKSDKDFYGHNVDKNYNPTYMRGTGSDIIRRLSTVRQYHESDKSYDTSSWTYDKETQRIISEYARNLKKARSRISEEDLQYNAEHFIPDSAPNALLQKPTLMQRFAEFLGNRKHLRNIPFIKNFIEKNGYGKPQNIQTDISKKESKKQNDEHEICQKIPPEQANKYLNMENVERASGSQVRDDDMEK